MKDLSRIELFNLINSDEKNLAINIAAFFRKFKKHYKNRSAGLIEFLECSGYSDKVVKHVIGLMTENLYQNRIDESKIASLGSPLDQLTQEHIKECCKVIMAARDSVRVKSLPNDEMIVPGELVISPDNVTDDTIKKTVIALTKNQQKYEPLHIVKMLMGQSIEIDDHRKTLHYDPYSEVLYILANTYAGLVHARSNPNVSKKLKEDLIATLNKIFLVDPFKTTYQDRIKAVTEIVKQHTLQCINTLEVIPSDFNKMKAYPPYRIPRSEMNIDLGDGCIMEYNPRQKLTKAQSELNKAIFTPREKKQSKLLSPLRLFNKNKSSPPSLESVVYTGNPLGIKDSDSQICQNIYTEMKKQNEYTITNHSSAGRGVAGCSNLVKINLNFGDYKINQVLHSDITPMAFKKASNMNKKKYAENVAKIARSNLEQCLITGFGQNVDTEVDPIEKKRIFLTKSLMSKAKLMKILFKQEATMYDTKKSAIDSLKRDYENIEFISLSHPVNWFKKVGTYNKKEYIKLMRALMVHLKVDCNDEGVTGKVHEVLAELSSKPGWSNIKGKLDDLRSLNKLSERQKIGVGALARICEKLKLDSSSYSLNLDKWRNFEYSALDNIALSGICSPEYAMVDSHCKSGKDRTFQDFVFSSAMMLFVKEKGQLPNLKQEKDNDRALFSKYYLKIYDTQIAQRHASMDNVGCWGLKSTSNLPNEILQRLRERHLDLEKGPEAWNNITKEFEDKKNRGAQAVHIDPHEDLNEKYNSLLAKVLEMDDDVEDIHVQNKNILHNCLMPFFQENEKQCIALMESEYLSNMVQTTDLTKVNTEILQHTIREEASKINIKFIYDISKLGHQQEAFDAIAQVVAYVEQYPQGVHSDDSFTISNQVTNTDREITFGRWYREVECALTSEQKEKLLPIAPSHGVDNQQNIRA